MPDHPFHPGEEHTLAAWAEGMVWCSPERHGAMTGVMKTQIDWIPLALSSYFTPERTRSLLAGRAEGVANVTAAGLGVVIGIVATGIMLVSFIFNAIL